MKCVCIWVDRGLGLIKNGKFDNIIGTFRMGNGLLFGKLNFSEEKTFHIPEGYKSILLQKQKCPLFVIDAKTGCILNAVFDVKDKYLQLENGNKIELAGLDFTSKADLTTQVKMNLLIKGKFWEMLAKRLKEKWYIYLFIAFGGYGLIRFLEYLITVIFLHHT